MLHPFTKLSIAYIGILIGFVIMGIVFYAISSNDRILLYGPVQPTTYYITLTYFFFLLVISGVALWKLTRAKRIGVYFALASLVFSLLAPTSSQSGNPFQVVYWFAIPNSLIGILLLRSLKHLH